MSQEEIKSRAREAQKRFKEPYNKMMLRLEEGNKVKWLNAIKTFYTVAEPTKWIDLPKATREQIESSSDEQIKSLCKELCVEAINRDFVSWVSTGDQGNVGRDVYTALL